MLDVNEILDLHRTTVERWHRQEISNPYSGPLAIICSQHKFNFLLWHEEDIARSPDMPDSRIAAVKRAIDGYNQKRNDWIEKIDDYLIAELAARQQVASASVTMNTETPGSTIDRLSILALRIYHMAEQASRPDATSEHRDKTQARLAILHDQQADLSGALAELLADIASGRKRLKVYRQFKMYNDPSLNPYLYGQGRKAG